MQYPGMNDRFWGNNKALPSGKILYGCLGEENARRPGIYKFCSTDGININDAHVLSADSDISGNGEYTKPRPGSPCVALMTNDGSQCFIIGFHRPPSFAQDSDEDPSVGNPGDNQSAGDKVYRTEGGGTLILKSGGAVIIEGGPGTSIIMNPINNQATIRSANTAHIADGYKATYGRKEPGSLGPATLHEQIYHESADASGVPVTVRSGSVDGDVRRELSVGPLRETYQKDGSWIGNGQKYQWGSAASDEPAVLGNKLVDAVNTLIDIVGSLKVNTAWGPSTVPLPDTQTKLNQLKNELSGKILSTFLFLSKDPTSLE